MCALVPDAAVARTHGLVDVAQLFPGVKRLATRHPAAPAPLSDPLSRYDWLHIRWVAVAFVVPGSMAVRV